MVMSGRNPSGKADRNDDLRALTGQRPNGFGDGGPPVFHTLSTAGAGQSLPGCAMLTKGVAKSKVWTLWILGFRCG